MTYRISVDVGGTFTDLTIAEGEKFIGRHKSPTTPDDLTKGVFNCIDLASNDMKLSTKDLLNKTDVFTHGSTTATNAIIEEKGAKCGLICTKGTKYTLWKQEGRRTNQYEYKIPHNKILLRPYLCLDVEGRINSEGEEIVPLNEEQVRAAVRQLKEWNVKTIAVCLVWSIINDSHEKRVAKIIEEEWPGVNYSLSSNIQPILREYHRASCVVLNAMLQPIVTEYMGNLQEKLKINGFDGEVLIVVSNGGVVPIKQVMKRPVFLLFSGPSMGPVSGEYFGKREGVDNVLVIDMGGTSFDVSTIIDGKVTWTRDAKILRYPTGVAATDILALGAGGGSIAKVDRGGKLDVGPESSGAVPGPACYLRGGQEPTVTDACVVLGYIAPDYFLGGRMKISDELAEEVIKAKVADPLNLSVEKAAMGIYQVCKEKMVGGMLEMTVRRGIDPREFVVVAGGGATSMFAAGLAKEIGAKKVIIPRVTSELCAFGALNADIAMSSVASRYTDTKNFDYETINNVLGELESKGHAFLKNQPHGKNKMEYFCSARYPSQVTELEIPLSTNKMTSEIVKDLAETFHEASMDRYKTADWGSDVQFVMWRSVATAVTPRIKLETQEYSGNGLSSALMGNKQVLFEGEEDFIDTHIYNGESLFYGMDVIGPALVILPDTTIVIPPKFKISTQQNGDFIMDLPKN